VQVRPYLMADGGNVELIEIDGLKVRLKLNGACGSCPSSMTTMKMGIERRLVEKIPVRPCSCVHLRWRRTKRSWQAGSFLLESLLSAPLLPGGGTRLV
jgi:hypothetical protein